MTSLPAGTGFPEEGAKPRVPHTGALGLLPRSMSRGFLPLPPAGRPCSVPVDPVDGRRQLGRHVDPRRGSPLAVEPVTGSFRDLSTSACSLCQQQSTKTSCGQNNNQKASEEGLGLVVWEGLAPGPASAPPWVIWKQLNTFP